MRWREKLRRNRIFSKTLLMLFILIITYYLINRIDFKLDIVSDNQIEFNLIDERIKLQKVENVLALDDGITADAQKFMDELGLKDPGANGKAVVLPENISEETKLKIKEGFERNKFNSFLSDMVSLNRRIPDLRSDVCKHKIYSKKLPKCSIMISFHNENWMLLMRTVHSILNNSPLELIEEILLVDDASDRGLCVFFAYRFQLNSSRISQETT